MLIRRQNDATSLNEANLAALQSRLSNVLNGNDIDFEEQRRLGKIQEAAVNLGFKLAAAVLKQDSSSVEKWVKQQSQMPK
jgi:hypothetical protein